MRPAPARVERACSCASFLQVACLTGSLFLTVPLWRKVNCFRFVSKNRFLMQKYIFYFFPPLAYDSGTPCDEKHRNKNVWPYMAATPAQLVILFFIIHHNLQHVQFSTTTRHVNLHLYGSTYIRAHKCQCCRTKR